MSIAATVVICTHNPRPDYLRRTLKALQDQTLPLDQWELIVVDNASDSLLAADWDLSWHPLGRHVREEELGLAYARQRGMREAAADLMVFVDDDNVLAPNYLDEALRIERVWPQLGVWGGSIAADFEVEPPAYLQRYLGYLALRQISSPRWSNVATCRDAEPWGAGLCLRSSVAAAYCEYYRQSHIRLTDRSGKTLFSGGDIEICYVACSLGLGMGLFPELLVTHLIPRERLYEDYILGLIEGTETSNYLIGFKWRATMPRSPLGTIELIRSIKNIVTRRGFDRRAHVSGLRAALRARTIISAGVN